MLSRRDVLKLSAAATLCPVCRLPAADGPAAKDKRLARPKTLNDAFDFTPPTDATAWAARRTQLREQVQVATGLWPMPEKTPLNAVVRGKIDRDGYTVEKVHFDSLPGHVVTGNLYRPAGGKTGCPAVLFAHGHWEGGRLHDAGEAAAKAMVARGEEADVRQARWFMQALPITFARLGFVVFQYDMVGYAESTAVPHIARSGVPHPDGFADAMGELRLQSLMGLQTWNSVRAVDFVAGLADVDPKKIGVTGASGGGTQTFLLAAIDDRIAAAAPAVMVSAGMQGGCVCENCSLLRVNTGNIELAGVFAPKPLAMTGANDWTKEVMTRGLPELRRLYKLLGAEENVAAKAWVQFPHNYNKPAREFVYGWFNKHLQGKPGPVAEPTFDPLPVAELRVFDAEYPRPKTEVGVKALRAYLTQASDEQLAKRHGGNGRLVIRGGDNANFRKVAAPALWAMVNSGLPAPGAVGVEGYAEEQLDGATKYTATIARWGSGEAVPSVGLTPPGFDQKAAVLFLHPAGVASLLEGNAPSQAAKALLAKGYAVFAVDAFGTGAQTPVKPTPDPVYAGFTWGYNRTRLAEQVHDALTALGNLRDNAKIETVYVVGWGNLGVAAVLATALAPGKVGKLAADLDQFRFEAITDLNDSRMLPGAVKYGGLPAFLRLCAPTPVLTWNGAGNAGAKTPAEVAGWLVG